MRVLLIAATSFFMFQASLLGLTGPAFGDISSADRQKIEAIIQDYIQANPEILRDALRNLAEAEARAAQQAGLALVYENNGDPYIGAENPELIIYEFSDYNCGYCKRVFPDLMAILNQDPSLRLVIKEFPILADSSVLAARAGIAAHKQQKFADFHIGMMGWRGRLDAQAIEDVAKEAGMDIAQMQRDMADPKTDLILNRTRQAASALDLRGTPALIIGDVIVPGAISREEILDLIKQAQSDKNS